MELWTAIPDVREGYEVSTHGRVRSLRGQGRIMAQSTNKGGYENVTIRSDRKANKYLVHRLVAMAFLGPIPAGKEVNHKNGNKGDNSLQNLEYATRSENMQHAKRMGLRAPIGGEKNPNSILTALQVIEIRRRIEAGEGRPMRLAEEFKVSESTIRAIAHRRIWREV